MADGIDYREIAKDVKSKAQFPATTVEEFRVHIEQDAYDKMKKHAETTTEVELCGVLVGHVHHEDADDPGP